MEEDEEVYDDVVCVAEEGEEWDEGSEADEEPIPLYPPLQQSVIPLIFSIQQV